MLRNKIAARIAACDLNRNVIVPEITSSLLLLQEGCLLAGDNGLQKKKRWISLHFRFLLNGMYLSILKKKILNECHYQGENNRTESKNNSSLSIITEHLDNGLGGRGVLAQWGEGKVHCAGISNSNIELI